MIPALVQRFHEGRYPGASYPSGVRNSLRYFLHVGDMAAEACLFLMKNYSPYAYVNAGYASGISVINISAYAHEVPLQAVLTLRA